MRGWFFGRSAARLAAKLFARGRGDGGAAARERGLGAAGERHTPEDAGHELVDRERAWEEAQSYMTRVRGDKGDHQEQVVGVR